MANDLSDLRAEFERCRDAINENHLTAIEDIEFCDLERQWPEDIVKKREAEERPMLTINKLPAFKRQVVNDARQNKPSIKVQPVDDTADPATADVMSGIIRNIEAVSNADVAYDTASDQAVGGGFGYWRVAVDYAYDDSFDLDILIKRMINQFAVYGDPNSTEADSSDWDVAFVTDRISKARFAKEYKGKAEVDFDSEAWRGLESQWLNDDGVLIAEYWARETVERNAVMLDDGRIFDLEEYNKNSDLQRMVNAGVISVRGMRPIRSKKVTQTIMSGADILQQATVFPSRYIPIVPVYGSELLVQGKRLWRSLIHSAIDSQRMVNYWETTATELLALSPRVPFIGPKGFAASDDGWESANTANHPYLEYDGPQAPQRQPLDTGPAIGAIQEALRASDNMKAIMGLHDASLGARSNETSGKAIMARQREGDVSTFHFQDNLNRAIRHTGKILVDMIPRVYTGERVLRILGEDGQPQNVKVNAPYEVKGPDGQPTMEPTDAVDMQGNRIMQAITAMHDLATGKYDVVVKAGPSFTSRREEAAYQMTELVRSAPMTAPIVIPKLAKMNDWPGAQELADELQAFMNPDAGGLPPEVQQAIEQAQGQIEELTAENEALKAKLADKGAQIEVNAMKVQNDARNNAAKAETDRFNADTKRMEVEIEVAGAQQRKAVGLPIT